MLFRSSWNHCRIGIGWWTDLLRGDKDGAWVFSGAGRISRDRDSFMEGGKDLVRGVCVSGGSGK